MQRVPIETKFSDFPSAFHPILLGAQLYDSSCSPEASVYYIDKGDGFFLKTAPKGTLSQEAAMTQLYHNLGFAPAVLEFAQEKADWLLTARVKGEDCIHPQYLDDPRRLSALLGQSLRALHDAPLPEGVPNRTAAYIDTAWENYRRGVYDATLFPDNWGYRSAEEAWAVVESTAPKLQCDTLIHGDYCLPNIILQDWKLSAFIDLGAAGAGDRHIDLFWGAWTLVFNLKTDAWRNRFLDAYGRDKINTDILNSIGAFEVFG